MVKQQQSPAVAVADLTNAIGLLLRRMRTVAASDELSFTETAVLARLEMDGPMTIADLARAESVKPQSMGTTIAALEAEGLVGRKPHPTDGRQMNTFLTSKGIFVRHNRMNAKHAWLMQAVGQLSEKDQETLFKACEIIKRLSDK
jgi:DNA-binding MarR family transcriptional regulator